MHIRPGIVLITGIFVLLSTVPLHAQQGSAPALPEPKNREDVAPFIQRMQTLDIVGRLTLEQRQNEEWLVLHSKDAKTYIISGTLRDRLKKTYADLGEKNLVAVKGTLNGDETIACRNNYQFNEKGEQEVSTQCIRHFGLEVIEIISAKVSDEIMPPPERDAAQEAIARNSALAGQMPSGAPNQIIEVTGTIASINFMGAIKTMELAFKDKFGTDLKKSMLINPTAKIAMRKPGIDAPVYVAVNALKAGQEVTVVYLRRETSNEAIAITILKE